MDDVELKKRFGVELAKSPDNPFKAALAVFGADTGSALMAQNRWIFDPIVIEARDEFIGEHGEAVNLPTKQELAARVWRFAEEKNAEQTRYLHDGKDRLTAYKLVGEIMGYIEKPTTQINNTNNVTQNKVMVLQDFGSNDDWEKKLEAQQGQLIHDARH